MSIRDAISAYYDRVNRGAWDEWLELFREDVTGDEQLAGHFEGIAVLRGARDAISAGYRRFQMHPLHVVCEGQEACVVWRCEAANRNGVPIAYPGDPARPVIGANYFRFRDGKIDYIRTMHDSLPFRPFTHPDEFTTITGESR
jgi:ketosteroid isomerase-like protein